MSDVYGFQSCIWSSGQVDMDGRLASFKERQRQVLWKNRCYGHMRVKQKTNKTFKISQQMLELMYDVTNNTYNIVCSMVLLKQFSRNFRNSRIIQVTKIPNIEKCQSRYRILKLTTLTKYYINFSFLRASSIL